MSIVSSTTPSFDLRWHTYMRVKAPYKIPRVIKHMQKRLRHPLELLSPNPYRPGRPVIYVALRTPLSSSDFGNAIFDTLYLAQRLGKDWKVKGPRPLQLDLWFYLDQVAQARTMPSAGGWEFWGYAKKSSVIGVEQIWFSLVHRFDLAREKHSNQQ